MDDAELKYLTMRNVARRFQKRWSLTVHPEHGHCWRQMVGGHETLEPCLPGEVDAVGELDAMGRTGSG